MLSVRFIVSVLRLKCCFTRLIVLTGCVSLLLILSFVGNVVIRSRISSFSVLFFRYISSAISSYGIMSLS